MNEQAIYFPRDKFNVIKLKLKGPTNYTNTHAQTHTSFHMRLHKDIGPQSR